MLYVLCTLFEPFFLPTVVRKKQEFFKETHSLFGKVELLGVKRLAIEYHGSIHLDKFFKLIHLLQTSTIHCLWRRGSIIIWLCNLMTSRPTLRQVPVVMLA